MTDVFAVVFVAVVAVALELALAAPTVLAVHLKLQLAVWRIGGQPNFDQFAHNDFWRLDRALDDDAR